MASLQAQLSQASNAVEYQRIALENVLADKFIANWTPLTIRRNGRVLVIDVLGLPLALDDGGSPVYLMASATLQQLVADHLHALLPTSLVMDEMHRQATAHIPPSTHLDWVKDLSMGKPVRLVQQSVILAGLIGQLTDRTLVADAWKTWALAAGLASHRMEEGGEQAYNHGLYTNSATSVTLGGLRAIQVLGGAHGRFEIDYSQVILLMRDTCLLDGVQANTAGILGDPTTAHLLSDEGVLTVTRQPGNYDDTAFGVGGPPPAAHMTIRQGSSGPDVVVWQQLLGVEADGIFGPVTAERTREWQHAHGLAVDGIVGPNTWRAAGLA